MNYVKIIIVIVTALAMGFPVYAESFPEDKVQECACQGMLLEQSTGSGTTVDCISETHAIEVEASQDWAEAIGQSLHYAKEMDKLAKIMVFCEQSPSSCLRHRVILDDTIRVYELPIEVEAVPEHCVAFYRKND